MTTHSPNVVKWIHELRTTANHRGRGFSVPGTEMGCTSSTVSGSAPRWFLG